MGKLITKLNPVIMESSMFITSSFLAFISSISSRVRSRVSMYDRSSTSFFFLPPPKTKVGDAREVEIADGGTKASAEGTVVAINAATSIRTRVIIFVSVVLCACSS